MTTNQKVITILILIIGMLLWAVAIVRWEDNTLKANVDLPWFWEYQDWLATYWYQKCLENLWNIKWTYSCENFILTLNSENWWRNKDIVSPQNWNWTRDYGLCQLNSAYHSNFINSSHFADPYRQIEYCLWVWQDAKKKWVMPRHWFKMRHKRDKGIVFNWLRTIYPPLSDKITKPNLPKPTKICRKAGTIQKDEYLQIDNKRGQFKLRLRELRIGDKVFICRDL